MYITTIYDIVLQGDKIYDLNDYLETFGIKTKDNYEINVWGEVKFVQSENDQLENFEITKIELLKNNIKQIFNEEIEKKLIEAVKNSINDNYFYYDTYNNGELYFINEPDEYKNSLAEFFKTYIL